MKQHKKIFFIGPAIAMGGMERAAVNTANGLHQLGSEVVFLCIFRKEHFYQLEPGITLLEPEGFNKDSLSLYQTVKWIRREVLQHKPDVVLVFNKFYGALTAIAIMGLGIRFYLSERSSPFFRWHFPFNIINRVAYWLHAPKGVIAQTEIAATYQRKYFRRSKIEVIPNSVRDVALYPTIQREKVILAVGRLNDYLKGFDLLLQAFAKVQNHDWELHIAGGDEEGSVLQQQARDLGIAERVKFLGKIKDIDRCFAYAGIYVIPSRSEGFPNALAEALAAGCCCVAFDFVAGPRDMIRHGENGMIVPFGDTSALAATIDELVAAEELRKKMSEQALPVREQLAVDKIVQRIQAFVCT